MRNIRVSAVQFEHAPGDKMKNLEKIRRFVETAAARKVEIVAFPECCIVGYWFLRNLSHRQLHELAEPVPNGPSSQALLALARQSGLTIGAGLLEVDGHGELHNTYVAAMPNGDWRRHRKIHAFEHDEVIPGSEFTVFDDPHGCRVGVLICSAFLSFARTRIGNLLLYIHELGTLAFIVRKNVQSHGFA